MASACRILLCKASKERAYSQSSLYFPTFPHTQVNKVLLDCNIDDTSLRNFKQISWIMLPSQCRVLFRKCSCSLPFVTFVTNSFLLFCSLCQACSYKYFQRSFLEPTTLFTPPQTSNQEIFKKNMRYSPAYTLCFYTRQYILCVQNGVIALISKFCHFY